MCDVYFVKCIVIVGGGIFGFVFVKFFCDVDSDR